MTPNEYAHLALQYSGLLDHLSGYYERQFLKAVELVVTQAIREERERFYQSEREADDTEAREG